MSIQFFNRNVYSLAIECHRGVGKLASSDHFFPKEVLSRIAALALPIIYTSNAIVFFLVGLGVKLVRAESFLNNEHALGGYLWKIALFYLKQVRRSPYYILSPREKSVIVPENLIEMLPKKAVVCRNGFNSRVGANINSYIKGRWIVYQLKKKNPKIEFVYRSFNMDKYLQLSRVHNYLIPEPYLIQGSSLVPGFKTLGNNPNNADFTSIDDLERFFEENDGVIEIIPFKAVRHIKIDWKDQEFVNLIRDEIRSTPEIESKVENQLSLPPDSCSYSIALHIRTGGDFDPGDTKFKLPAKIPPRNYYEYAIDRALENCNNEGVYIRIFTDSTNPQEVKKYYKEYILANHPQRQFQIDVCEDTNKQKKSVLLDIFSMTKYDALIRPDSMFSSLSGILTDYKFEIFPSKCTKTKNASTITQVKIIERDHATLEERQKEVHFSHSR